MTTPQSKWIFFGTDEFSVGVLNVLAKNSWRPDLIVTMKDTPQGRKMILTPPAVKVWAEKENIKVIQPESLKTALEFEQEAWDFFVVASYGKIIPQRILDIPNKGVLNVHPSLLPLYRGASPIQSAILVGDEISGVSIMLIDAEMDHGPILDQIEINMSGKNYLELEKDLAEKGGELLVKTLPSWLSDNLAPKEQAHEQATFTKKIAKEDGELDLSKPAEENLRKIRAFNPWPVAYFHLDKNGKKIRIKVLSAHLENDELVFDTIIPEGKKEMKWEDYKRNLN